MKKAIVWICCMVMVLAMTACESNQEAKNAGDMEGDFEKVSAEEPIGSSVQLANPFVECETMQEATNLAGFSMEAPQTVLEDFSHPIFRVIPDRMIEIIYQDGAGDEGARVRKAAENGDISGDYNQYDEQSIEELDGRRVTMRGNEGKLYGAIWTEGGYAFAVSVREGADHADMASLASSVR